MLRCYDLIVMASVWVPVRLECGRLQADPYGAEPSLLLFQNAVTGRVIGTERWWPRDQEIPEPV